MSSASDQTQVESNPEETERRRPNGEGLRGPLNWFGFVFGVVVLVGVGLLFLTDGSGPADDLQAVEVPAEPPPVDEHDEAAAEPAVDAHDEAAGVAREPEHSDDEAAGVAREPEHSDDEAAPMVDDMGTTVIEIEMVDFAYRPDTVEIQAGVPFTFRFTNTGNFEHEAMVGDMHEQEEFEADGDHEADDGHHGDVLAVLLQPGETADLEVLIDEPGTTYMACHVRGHFEQGQIATINVVA